jgi:hypothetical protein
MSWGPFDLPAGDFVQYDYDTIVNETTTNIAYVEGYDAAGGVWTDYDDATNVVVGNEGCTPGYWKNNAIKWGASAWAPTGYNATDKFSDVFGVVITVRAGNRRTITDPTLLQALQATGGGVDALARSAVAALLNAAHPDINYAIADPQDVIDMVYEALTSGDPYIINELHGDLDWYNNAGCPLDMRGNPIIMDAWRYSGVTRTFQNNSYVAPSASGSGEPSTHQRRSR